MRIWYSQRVVTNGDTRSNGEYGRMHAIDLCGSMRTRASISFGANDECRTTGYKQSSLLGTNFAVPAVDFNLEYRGPESPYASHYSCHIGYGLMDRWLFFRQAHFKLNAAVIASVIFSLRTSHRMRHKKKIERKKVDILRITETKIWSDLFMKYKSPDKRPDCRTPPVYFHNAPQSLRIEFCARFIKKNENHNQELHPTQTYLHTFDIRNMHIHISWEKEMLPGTFPPWFIRAICMHKSNMLLRNHTI